MSTDHSCELVKLWLEIGSPEVDVGSFISHLITGRDERKINTREESAQN